MWLEGSIWLWGPLAGLFGAWTVWRTLAAERAIRRLRDRVAELEGGRHKARRQAA